MAAALEVGLQLLLLVLFWGAPRKAPQAAGVPPPPPLLPQDAEFTFLLPAGRRECFYQVAPGNTSMEVEYQVIGGAGLDVDFSLASPSGSLLVEEFRKSDGVHTIEPTESGDYKLCFDNSFSTISEKLVFFELIFDSPQEDEDVNHWAEVAEPEEMLDIKIEDIKVGQEAEETENGGMCKPSELGHNAGFVTLVFDREYCIVRHYKACLELFTRYPDLTKQEGSGYTRHLSKINLFTDLRLSP